MSKRQGVLVNSLSQVGVRLLGSAAALVMTWVIARQSVDDLGVFRTIFVYFLASEFLPLLGMQTYLMRETAVRTEQIKKLVLHAGLFAAAVAVLSMLALAAVSYWGGYGGNVSTGLLMVAAGMPATAGTLVSLAILVGAGRATQFSLIQGGETLLRTAVGIVCILAGWGVLSVIAAMVVIRWLVLLGYWRALRSLLGLGEWRFDPEFFRTFLSAVPTFAGITLLSIVTRFAAQAVLPWMLDDAAAGQFAAAYVFIDLALMVPTALSTSLMPVLARKAVESSSALAETCSDGLKLMVTSVLPVSVVLTAIAPALFAIVLPGDQSYVMSARILQIVIWVCAFQAMDQVLASTIIAKGKQGVDLQTVAIGASVLLLLLIVLIPRYGVLGAAYSAVGTSGLSFLVRLYLVGRHVHGIRAHEAVWRAVLAAAVATAGAISVAAFNWLMALIVGGGAYLGVLAFTGAFSRRQRAGVLHLLQGGRA